MIAAFEKNTGPIRLVFQRQPTSIGVQIGIGPDEIFLRHGQKFSHAGDILVAQTDGSRPSATIATALAKINVLRGHGAIRINLVLFKES
jgi:hypothetical protein